MSLFKNIGIGTEAILRQILNFIDKNYVITYLGERLPRDVKAENIKKYIKFSKSKQTFVINCPQYEITTLSHSDKLTNGLFKWGRVSSFLCNNSKIKNLIGGPEVCDYRYECYYCIKLESFEGAPRKCKKFMCSGLWMDTIDGLQDVEVKEFEITTCLNLRRIIGGPKTCDRFTLGACENLTDVSGAPYNCLDIYIWPGKDIRDEVRLDLQKHYVGCSG